MAAAKGGSGTRPYEFKGNRAGKTPGSRQTGARHFEDELR